MFALNHVPFSLFGSYLSLSSLRKGVTAPPNAEALYLRTHRGRVGSALQLELIRDGEPVVLEAVAQPYLLRYADAQGYAELCFSGVRSLPRRRPLRSIS